MDHGDESSPSPINVAQRLLQAFRVRISHPAAKMCAVSTQTPKFKSLHASMIDFNSSNARQSCSPAPRYFREGFEVAELSTRAPLAEDCRNRGDRDSFAAVSPATRMKHEKICAENHRANNLLMKCQNRARAQNRVRRCEIDQIIAMDDEWPERKFFASLAKTRRIRLGDARCAAIPHPGARRKNLQRISAEFLSDIERSRDITGNRSVDSDADAAIFPGGDFRRRGRFRTILVGGVKSQATSVLFVRHSLRLSGCQGGTVRSFAALKFARPGK